MSNERFSIFLSLQAILDSHGFDHESGLVSDLGKYENESIETLFYWEASCGGASGDVLADYDTHSEYVELQETTETEREVFGAESNQTFYMLRESNEGFLYGKWLTQEEADAIRKEYETADGDESEEDGEDESFIEYEKSQLSPEDWAKLASSIPED